MFFKFKITELFICRINNYGIFEDKGKKIYRVLTKYIF